MFILIESDKMIYTVAIDEEAVITQEGRVVGNSRKPGIHIRIPYLYKIHLVKPAIVRRDEFPVEEYEDISLEIFWKIDNVVTYFESNQKLNLDNNFENIVSKHVSELIDSNKELKLYICDNKHKIKHSAIIMNVLGNLIESYGIKLIDAFILLDSNLAQPDA